MSHPRVHLGHLAHGGIVRLIPGCPRLHIESGWIRPDRPGGKERLVWLVYLRPAPRSARILEFPAAGIAIGQQAHRRQPCVKP